MTNRTALRGCTALAPALLALSAAALALAPSASDAQDDAPDAPTRSSPFEDAARPRMLGEGALSSAQGEFSPTFDAERSELVFMRRTPGRFDYTLWTTRWTADGWSDPAVLPFSGDTRDAGPSFASDGATLLFDSDRPAEGLEPGSINVWRVERDGDGWGSPELVREASENPPPYEDAGADEFGPTLDAAGNLYFYSFRRPLRGGAHYALDGDGSDAVERDEALPDPSARTFVAYATFSADGRFAVLEGRARSGRDTDLFLTLRTEEGWSEARPIASVNTPANEGTPSITSDGRHLLFGSTRREGGASDLFVVDIAAVLETGDEER